MKKQDMILLGIACLAILIIYMNCRVREHLTGQVLFTPTDATGYPNTAGSTTFDDWFVPAFPQGTTDSTTYMQIAKATLWFVIEYSPNYAKATAPLSKDDFYKDFLTVYNNTIVVLADNGVPGPGASFVNDPTQFSGNTYAGLVYDYYYGPKSKTPYASTLAPIAPPPKPPAPSSPAPVAPSPTFGTSAAPPAASSSPNQPLTFYLPQPCKSEYKNVPGGSLEVRCFN